MAGIGQPLSTLATGLLLLTFCPAALCKQDVVSAVQNDDCRPQQVDYFFECQTTCHMWVLLLLWIVTDRVLGVFPQIHLALTADPHEMRVSWKTNAAECAHLPRPLLPALGARYSSTIRQCSI